jgi:hypothetical protein
MWPSNLPPARPRPRPVQGVPAVALSLDSHMARRADDYAASARLAAAVVHALLAVLAEAPGALSDMSEGLVLNVNVPAGLGAGALLGAAWDCWAHAAAASPAGGALPAPCGCAVRRAPPPTRPTSAAEILPAPPRPTPIPSPGGIEQMRGVKLTHQGTGCFFPNFREVHERQVRGWGGGWGGRPAQVLCCCTPHARAVARRLPAHFKCWKPFCSGSRQVCATRPLHRPSNCGLSLPPGPAHGAD